jgi:DNA-binding transcriptional LysR family regulator
MDGARAQPLDLRKLDYFVAVAEELHFGRAAERVHLSQSVLSRSIRRLEGEIDTPLLVRDSRNVALTPAGKQLLVDARVLLASADSARRRAHDLGTGLEELTVGFFVGDAVAPAIQAFHELRPHVEISLLRVYWHNQVDVLRDGRADIGFLHLPVAEQGLELMPVRREPRVVLLPASHPLAAQETVTIGELADDPVIQQGGADPTWEAFHNVDPRPDGHHPIPGPKVWNIEEKFEHVAAGGGIGLVPASAAAAYARAGVVARPIMDIPPMEVCLAWLKVRATDLIADFAASVRTAESKRGLAALSAR